jgi:hypothetical protein
MCIGASGGSVPTFRFLSGTDLLLRKASATWRDRDARWIANGILRIVSCARTDYHSRPSP